MGREVEIIPPSRGTLTTAGGGGHEVMKLPARENPGGMISSTLTRWEANRHARTYGALAARTRAEADYFDAQSEAIQSYIRRAQAGHRLNELPEILSVDRARRRAERAEELRELQHRHQIAETRRVTELTNLQIVLEDAQQALRAQREHGYLTHKITWERRNCELLGIELDAAERRALLEEVRNPKTPSVSASEQELIEQLYAKREELRADGLDTGRIDAALARVGKL